MLDVRYWIFGIWVLGIWVRFLKLQKSLSYRKGFLFYVFLPAGLMSDRERSLMPHAGNHGHCHRDTCHTCPELMPFHFFFLFCFSTWNLFYKIIYRNILLNNVVLYTMILHSMI